MKKDSVTNIVGTNALYGRARRIEFVERMAYIIVAIIAVVLVFVIVGRNASYRDNNVNFSMLRSYLENRGYRCGMLHQPGGSCSLTTDVNLYNFFRYEDGFEYIVKSDAYLLNIKYSSSKGDSITFKTTSDALAGYRNKEYKCYYDKNILAGISYCSLPNGTKLDIEVYNSVIEKAIYDLNGMIDNSGYSKDKLLSDHIWKKISG